MARVRSECQVRRSFPLRKLEDRDNFLSLLPLLPLLHYFGLLSIRAAAPADAPEPIVPNQTAHHLLHAFLRDACRGMGAFHVDMHELDAAPTEAKRQLERYLADERLVRQRPEVSYTGLAVVFHGWGLARCDAIE